MVELPVRAHRIDPPLSEVGADQAYQQLVYGRVNESAAEALVVARLLSAHPRQEGTVGHFYGVRLRGLLLDGTFRPWRTEPLGEVRWDEDAGWVQAEASPS